MTDVIASKEYKGFTIEIQPDLDCGNDSPRGWSRASTMVMSHGRYNLPNEADLDFGEFDGWTEVQAHLTKVLGARVILPVSMTDHSGCSYYIGRPRDPWDSGQVGFIYMTAEQIRESFMVKRITKEIEAKAIELIASDVSVYNQWANGYVYGYTITPPGGDMDDDSLWGMYDDSSDFSYIYGEAQEAIDAEIAHRAKVAAQKAIDDLKLRGVLVTRSPRPEHYPSTANSGIADAEAFRVGDSDTVHRPGRFPDGNKVIAVCGVYGWAAERDARIASWADAYVDCERCNRRRR